MCNFKEMNLKFYNYYNKKDYCDETLFSFIYTKVNSLYDKCEKCHRPKYNHTTIYYYNNAYLLISVEEQFKINANEDYDEQKQPQSDNDNKVDSGNNPNQNQLTNQLINTKDIEMFIECANC